MNGTFPSVPCSDPKQPQGGKRLNGNDPYFGTGSGRERERERLQGCSAPTGFWSEEDAGSVEHGSLMVIDLNGWFCLQANPCKVKGMGSLKGSSRSLRWQAEKMLLGRLTAPGMMNGDFARNSPACSWFFRMTSAGRNKLLSLNLHCMHYPCVLNTRNPPQAFGLE